MFWVLYACAYALVCMYCCVCIVFAGRSVTSLSRNESVRLMDGRVGLY